MAKVYERLAEEARMAKPMVKRRVPDRADTVLAALAKTPIAHPGTAAVAELIRERCENFRDIFRSK
jgi:hypothetical protein